MSDWLKSYKGRHSARIFQCPVQSVSKFTERTHARDVPVRSSEFRLKVLSPRPPRLRVKTKIAKRSHCFAQFKVSGSKFKVAKRTQSADRRFQDLRSQIGGTAEITKRTQRLVSGDFYTYPTQ